MPLCACECVSAFKVMRNNAHSSKRFDRYLHPYPKKRRRLRERFARSIGLVSVVFRPSWREHVGSFFCCSGFIFFLLISNPKTFLCVCETLKFLSPFFTCEQREKGKNARNDAPFVALPWQRPSVLSPPSDDDRITRRVVVVFFFERERKYGGSSSSSGSARD